MEELLQYKCPCCGGAVEFNSSIQKMKCPYCDSEFDVDALTANDDGIKDEDSMNWSIESDNISESEAAGINIYKCQSCGGEIAADASTGAASCPYCGNPVVMSGQFSGELKPDLVVPFKIDKEAAKQAVKKHISSKKLMPKVFKDENHIDEIKGIYVPYWLFDCTANGSAVYKGEKVRTWEEGNFRYEETSVYRIDRSGSLAFAQLPVDGSSKMADDLMESIEPFDASEGVDFNTAYLSGYLADKYDVTSEKSQTRANERIKESFISALSNTVSGFGSVNNESAAVTLENAKCRYALYPVWILNTSWNGEKFTFAVNGQTGKAVGDLPMDKKAFKLWTGILTAAIGAGAYIFMTLLNLL